MSAHERPNHPLIAAAVDAVAPRYDVDPDGLLAILLVVYWDGGDASHFAPLAYRLSERRLEALAELGRIEDLFAPLEGPEEGEELNPREGDMAACQALLAATEDDFDLVPDYYEALAGRLHERIGVPVLVDSYDGVVDTVGRSTLAAQLGPRRAAVWEANDWLPRNRGGEAALAGGLDVVLHRRLGPDDVAGIYRSGSGLFVTDHLSPTCGGAGLKAERVYAQGDSPVVAGLLPPGAITARVQDLFDAWHDADVAEGAFLAVLPHPARGGPPPVVFTDADGARVLPRECPQTDTFESWVTFGAVDPEWDEAAFQAEQDREHAGTGRRAGAGALACRPRGPAAGRLVG